MKVWSAEKFARGEIDLWPFECSHILGFRGTSREIFFPREHSSDLSEKYQGLENERRLPSVLKTRYLIPANSLGTQNSGNSFQNWKNWYIGKVMEEHELNEEQAERVWKEFIKSGKPNRAPKYEEMLDTKEPGVFFAPESVVKSNSEYFNPRRPEDILLKVLIPTDSVVFNNRRRNKDNIKAKNLRMMKNGFGSKEELRELCKSVVETGHMERLQYITADAEVGWIEGVLDPENSDEFVDLSSYLRWLEKECFWEMDKYSFEIIGEEALEEELKFLKELYNQIQKLEYYLKMVEKKEIRLREVKQKQPEKFEESLRPSYSVLDQYKELLENVLKIIEGEKVKGPGFDEVLMQTENLIDREFQYFEKILESEFNKGYELDTSHLGRSIKNLEDFFQNLNSELEEMEKIKENISRLKSELKSHSTDNFAEAEKLKEEINFEAKIDRKIFNKIKEFPRVSNIEDQIKKELEAAQDDLKQLEEEHKTVDLSKYSVLNEF